MNRITFPLLFVLAISGINVCSADSYCEAMPKAEKEGDVWYIPESAFTKENAQKALSELDSQINNGVEGLDFLIENELAMIKGYLYLSY